MWDFGVCVALLGVSFSQKCVFKVGRYVGMMITKNISCFNFWDNSALHLARTARERERDGKLGNKCAQIAAQSRFALCERSIGMSIAAVDEDHVHITLQPRLSTGGLHTVTVSVARHAPLARPQNRQL